MCLISQLLTQFCSFLETDGTKFKKEVFSLLLQLKIKKLGRERSRAEIEN
jgi:hypothetical protein